MHALVTAIGARVISVDAAFARRGGGDREPRAARRCIGAGGTSLLLTQASVAKLMRLAARGIQGHHTHCRGSADLWTASVLEQRRRGDEGILELRDRLGVFGGHAARRRWRTPSARGSTRPPLSPSSAGSVGPRHHATHRADRSNAGPDRSRRRNHRRGLAGRVQHRGHRHRHQSESAAVLVLV